MYRLAKAYIDLRGDSFDLPSNNVPVGEYCFLNIVSETGKATELRRHAKALGLTPSGKAHAVEPTHRYGDRVITAGLPVVETLKRWREDQPMALVWVKIPVVRHYSEARYALPVRADIAPLSEAEYDDLNNNYDFCEVGVANWGEDIDGEMAVIISGWEFYHILPLLGYTWQSLLTHLGVKSDDDSDPEVFGFEDDSDSCGECGIIDHRDNGYTYNFRETPGGDYMGVNCGCFEEACKAEFRDNVNDSDRAITLESARELAREGKLKFVERFIGGWTDPGRGGHFRVEEGEPDFSANGGSVNNGDPEEVLKAALERDPDGEYIMSHDESGQFQTYFSLWQVTDESEA